jgi:hypothetical protein
MSARVWSEERRQRAGYGGGAWVVANGPTLVVRRNLLTVSRSVYVMKRRMSQTTSASLGTEAAEQAL